MCPYVYDPERSDVVEDGLDHIIYSLGTTPVEVKVGASRNSARQIVYIQNQSNKPIYWGKSTVSSTGSTKGVALEPDQFVSLPYGDVGVYVVGEQADQAVLFGEVE